MAAARTSPIDAAREAQRIATLRALDLLDTAPQREFDALVALAATMLECPTALVTMIDEESAWFIASSGSPLAPMPRCETFCNHAIADTEPLIVADLSTDTRFRDYRLVSGPEAFRFYAGAPIHALDGHGEMQPVGAICVLDHAPRTPGEPVRQTLQHLASLAETLIAARRNARAAIDIARGSEHQAYKLARQDRVFRQAERLTLIGSWRLAIEDQTSTWSEGMYRIHDLPVGRAPDLADALGYYPAHARGVVSGSVARSLETGDPFHFETDFLSARQQLKRVRCHGEVEYADGLPVALVGVFQDITEQYRLEQQLRRLADTDALTGIANRAVFERALPDAIDRARERGTPLLLALIDLDGFKAINDTFGHTAGDDVLRLVGERLSGDCLGGCQAARLGGDEFAVIVDDPLLAASPARVQAILEEALQLSIIVADVPVMCAGSVGVAALDDECGSARDFLRKADVVLYQAKRARVGERRRRTDRFAA